MAELMIFNTVEVNGEPWLAGKDVAQAPAHYVRRVPLPLSVYGVTCLLYTSPSPRDGATSRMPSSA